MSWGRSSAIVGLLGVLTVAFHAVSHGENVPIHRPLASFPGTIGDWKGQDLAIDPRITNILKADDLLLRAYRNPQAPPIWLYVAYFQSQRQLQTVHSPKNCLPGAGWEPLESRREALDVGAGQRVFLNRYVVENGLDQQLVFYWYQSHGRTVASEYRAKVYLALDAIRLNRTDGALVRVSTPIVGNRAAAEQSAREFLREIYPFLRQYIPE